MKRHPWHSIFISGGKWRGVMPFRLSNEYRNLLDQHKRTGEPFPAFYAVGEIRDGAHGKANGSFTGGMRSALKEWIKAQTGLPQGQIQFDYKLYRHKIIHVTGHNAYLKHDHLRGIGLKGFILELTVLSIDGITQSTQKAPLFKAGDE